MSLHTVLSEVTADISSLNLSESSGDGHRSNVSAYDRQTGKRQEIPTKTTAENQCQSTSGEDSRKSEITYHDAIESERQNNPTTAVSDQSSNPSEEHTKIKSPLSRKQSSSNARNQHKTHTDSTAENQPQSTSTVHLQNAEIATPNGTEPIQNNPSAAIPKRNPNKGKPRKEAPVSQNQASSKSKSSVNDKSKKTGKKSRPDKSNSSAVAPTTSKQRKPPMDKSAAGESNSRQKNSADSVNQELVHDRKIYDEVLCIVRAVEDDCFFVKIEDGPYRNRSLRCLKNQMSDPSIPLLVNATKFQVGIIIEPEKSFIRVRWANLQNYVSVTSYDVEIALDDCEYDTHEQFIRKMYFSWRPFLKVTLIHSRRFDEDTLTRLLKLTLPPVRELRPCKNKHHNLRFQEIIEMFASEHSTFLSRLAILDTFADISLVKRLVQFLASFTKQLSPLGNVLKKYYMDDPAGLIELIGSCSEGIKRSLACENFRDVPLIPVMDELSGVINSLVMGYSQDDAIQSLLMIESHLQPNRIDGPWDSPEEFLNVHFRLLREECFASIRNRIASARLDPDNCKQVHRDVKVIGFAISDGTMVLQLQYKAHKARTNFMFGNLLCVDSDTNFSNPIWATVRSSEMKGSKIAIALIGVGDSFVDTSGKDSDGSLSADVLVSAVQRLIACQSAVMVESITYYHAFKPVLARLQNVDENEFPFESEILLKSVEPQPSPLKFALDPEICESDELESVESSLESIPDLEISKLEEPESAGAQASSQKFPFDPRFRELDESQRAAANEASSLESIPDLEISKLEEPESAGAQASSQMFPFDPRFRELDESQRAAANEASSLESIPDLEISKLGEPESVEAQASPLKFPFDPRFRELDESQRAAANDSLSYRFSLIQGPPGCGKTFVGKEIIKAMLELKRHRGPILLMTYKNHALDSMLEGCLEFTKSVVRIGGKCDSEAVSEFNLHNLYKIARNYYSRENFIKLLTAQHELRELEGNLMAVAREFLSNFTTSALLGFLQRGLVRKQQLHSLLCQHFEKHYGQIIEQDVKYSSHEQVQQAVRDVLRCSGSLSERLLYQSLKEWLPEANVNKFLPCSAKSLFVKNSRTAKLDEMEKDVELEADEWERILGERQVGFQAKLDFFSLSSRRNVLYPELQNRMAFLDVDRRERDVRFIRDVWSLSPEGRYILFSFWLREWYKGKDDRLVKSLESYHRFYEQVKQMESSRNVQFLKSRDIVACTITGCCLRMNTISKMAPSVVIVEEAAEILESQLIAALPPSVRHLILIGDHKQLPPQVQHYRLARRFNMGVSIFERLAMNGYPVSQLRFHRRGAESLCPLFSRFYEQEIVPPKGDPALPEVLQKLGTMYWWTHSAPISASSETSLENEFEASMIVATIRFMTWLGGVNAEQITVITGYLGQAKKISKLLVKNKVEGVMVCTIDRFQGDENDIIFLSLTRSVGGPEQDALKPHSLGFLSSPNRMCVALSRARLCLYIFGCSSLFKSHYLWKETVEYFESKEKLGSELEFVVDEKVISFEHPNDFDLLFKKVELEKEEVKQKLQADFVKELPVDAHDGAKNVTSTYGKKMEKLMNDSVLNKRDLGKGRDAHGETFRYFKVTKVEEIFNKDMFTFYLHQKSLISGKKPKRLGFQIDSWADWMENRLEEAANEVFLFHGTNEKTAQLIIESGFDERLANLGGMFGAGIYFAENADKSDQYSREGTHHHMFLARVLLGRPFETPSTGNWRRPPAIDEKKPTKLFDSIIAVSKRKTGEKAAVDRHQEFVIFDRYQCYPEFLIQYERCK